ncbi:MAG TPA: class I SAM-dependent methyltransferase [Gammaproteobacteria bacterium]|nr:class I SAM-dependent methyltransferase [Gammaproteobacteria bacterium]HRP87080.1 class I SAM-dependent methyltransferase [Gammaproteobacteria bacterium]
MARDSKDKQGHRLDRDEWTRYWARGTVTTFEGHFSGNYDAEIRDFWWRQFETLADGSTMVDLATGNGALALLAASYAREHERSFTIVGVDSAALDVARLRAALPGLAADLDAVTLRGDTPLEDTGLPAATAGLVTSQFGFEYGDTAAGAREAFRLLRSGGRLAMILHHADSAILSQAREGLRQVELCVERERLLAQARLLIKLLRPARRDPSGRRLVLSPGAEKVRDDMLAAVERVRAYAARPEVQTEDTGFIEFMVPAVMRLVDQSHGVDPRRVQQAMAGLAGEIEAYRRRMTDLVSASRSRADMELVRAQLADAAFADIQLEPLYYGGETLLGWALTATRL